MRIWVFLLALSCSLASRPQSGESGDGRLSSRLRTLVERTQATKQPTTKRQSDDQITERQFRHHCGPNEVVGEYGRCERALVTKNVFAFTAPKYRRPIVPARIPQPKLDLNVVFVKTAPNDLPPLPLIVPPAQQKTVLYILSKRPHFNQQVIEVPSGGPTDPEVFFVNYGSGENPSLPGGIDLQTALRQAPLTGQVVSSPPVAQAQQGGFRSHLGQDFSFEDDNLQNSFIGQSSVPRGVLSQSQSFSPRFVPKANNQRQSSAEENQQLTPFTQFQSSPSNKLQSSSSKKFRSPPGAQFQSPPSNQIQPLPSNQFQPLPSAQFQSLPSNQFQSPFFNQQSPASDSFESDSIQQQIPYANHLFESSTSSQFQSPLSNQFQASVGDSFDSVGIQQQIPFANNLFESSPNNQFNSQSVHSLSSHESNADTNSDTSFESPGLQALTANEFGSNKQITVAQNINIDDSKNIFSRNPPATQHRTPPRVSSSSSSSLRSTPAKQFRSPSNSLVESPVGDVQLLQPSHFGIADDDSNERASVKKKISSLPSGFVPALQNQSSKKRPSSRQRFKPSQSLPNRQFKSPGTEAFAPVPGSQYILPPSDFQFIPPQDQSTASADQYRAPVVVQKLEPEQWEDVPTLKSSEN